MPSNGRPSCYHMTQRSPHRPRCFAPCSDTLLRPYADTIIPSESSVQIGRSDSGKTTLAPVSKRCLSTIPTCRTYQLSTFSKKYKASPTQQISTTTIKKIRTKPGPCMTRTAARLQHSGTHPTTRTTTPPPSPARAPPLETPGTRCCTTST